MIYVLKVLVWKLVHVPVSCEEAPAWYARLPQAAAVPVVVAHRTHMSRAVPILLCRRDGLSWIGAGSMICAYARMRLGGNPGSAICPGVSAMAHRGHLWSNSYVRLWTVFAIMPCERATEPVTGEPLVLLMERTPGGFSGSKSGLRELAAHSRRIPDSCVTWLGCPASLAHLIGPSSFLPYPRGSELYLQGARPLFLFSLAPSSPPFRPS